MPLDAGYPAVFSHMNDVPCKLGFRRPAEFEDHELTWMAWPHRSDLYGDRLGDVQQAYVNVARAISEFEPVNVVAHPAHAAVARERLGNRACVRELPIDDAWIRDSGPTFLKGPSGQLGGISWRFNAWGQKHAPWNEDDALAGRLLQLEGADMCRSWLTCEGGALATDGDGTVIVTETSILNQNRNPGVSKAFAEAELKAMLGVEKVVWLPGDPLDFETDGHVDEMCCFVRPGVVLFETNPDRTDPHSRILDENLAALRAATDARGRKFEVILVTEAIDATVTSDVFCRSYINFYLPNGGVVMPGYGTACDAQARAVIERAFPERKVVQVDVNAIAPAGGSIHCITQEQPRRFA